MNIMDDYSVRQLNSERNQEGLKDSSANSRDERILSFGMFKNGTVIGIVDVSYVVKDGGKYAEMNRLRVSEKEEGPNILFIRSVVNYIYSTGCRKILACPSDGGTLQEKIFKDAGFRKNKDVRKEGLYGAPSPRMRKG